MKKEDFRKLASEGIVYLDGATGSNLQKRGMPLGVCPDLWISENPEVLIGLQLEYLRAGARILYSPTFTANRIKLAEFGIEDRVEELNGILVNESKEAIRRFKKENPDAPECYVAGDITMTGRQLSPIGDLEFEELIDVYKEQIRALEKAGADLIVVETMISLQETRAAVIACKEVSDLPIIASMSFEENGKTFFGTDTVTALITLQSLGVSAFGVNCSRGPKDMKTFVSEMKKYAEIPVICKPNAGLPELSSDGSTVYSLSPEEFGRQMKEVAGLGANLMGGCCGTTPDHIAALTKETEDCKTVLPDPEFKGYVLTSERTTHTFSLDDRFFIIGERINPTGKKALQEELRENEFEMVTDFALSQEENGAKVLDINVGMSGVDEKELMLGAIGEVTGVTNLPLSIDTSHVEIMEAALRRYPGRALINSISLEEKKCEPMLSLAKKYGAMCILLPLSDAGIPETFEEKKRIILELVKRAEAHGLKKTDLIVDGLVGTVGANPKAALETIETIKFCRKELGLATVCGLSNISFGLPERIFVNSSFLEMAINAGLTTAIANPEQEKLVISALSADLLMGKKDADIAYIEYMDRYKERHAGDEVLPKNV